MSIGLPLKRVDAEAKVTGSARYTDDNIMLGFSSLVIGRICSKEWHKLNVGTVSIALALVLFYAGGWAI